jgi:hypothetical protein
LDKALKKVLVNLVDLVNYRHYDIPIRQFSSMREFREYTRRPNMQYSKQEAKRDGFLKILLREVYFNSKSAQGGVPARTGGAARAVKAAA